MVRVAQVLAVVCGAAAVRVVRCIAQAWMRVVVYVREGVRAVVCVSAVARAARCIVSVLARVVVYGRELAVPCSLVQVRVVMYFLVRVLLVGMWAPVGWPAVAEVSERAPVGLGVTVSPSYAA